jgi:hypothetical protein
MLVFDTETTTDATQRLLFGSYRFIDRANCLEEGLFYPEDLRPQELALLSEYVERHWADTVKKTSLKLLTLREFRKKFYGAAYKARCLVVGFNLPFDLSRLGFDVAAARHEFGGGFSLGVWSYTDRAGIEHSDPHRPRITIKHLDSKRALTSFTGRMGADAADLIPENSTNGKPQKGYRFRGHFLDLRTLAFALTDRGHSLKSACEAFGVERGKIATNGHGRISEKYIDYNRRDVEATVALAGKLLTEYDLHPISLQETKAFSPASIGASPDKFHLIAPFESDSAKWLKMRWIDQYSGDLFRIITQPNQNNRQTAWVKTYGDVTAEYEFHPESKCADEYGNPSDRQTVGLLSRRHIRIAEIVPIGKEANRLEEVDAGVVHSADSVYTVYHDPSRDRWTRDILPKLQKIPLSVLIRETGLSRRMLIKARKGHARPHPRNQELITDALRRLGFRV